MWHMMLGIRHHQSDGMWLTANEKKKKKKKVRLNAW